MQNFIRKFALEVRELENLNLSASLRQQSRSWDTSPKTRSVVVFTSGDSCIALFPVQGVFSSVVHVAVLTDFIGATRSLPLFLTCNQMRNDF